MKVTVNIPLLPNFFILHLVEVRTFLLAYVFSSEICEILLDAGADIEAQSDRTKGSQGLNTAGVFSKGMCSNLFMSAYGLYVVIMIIIFTF